MRTEDEVVVRKLRKKLRQIENLERLTRPLLAEEQFKVSKKDGIRSELLDLLATCSPGGRSCLTTALAGQSMLSDTSLESSDWREYDGSFTGGNHNSREQDRDQSEHSDQSEDECSDSDGESEENDGNAPDQSEDECSDHSGSGNRRLAEVQNQEQSVGSNRAETMSADKVRSGVTEQITAWTVQQEQTDSTDPEETTASSKKPGTKPNKQKGSSLSSLKQLQRKWSSATWRVDTLHGHNDVITSVSMSGRWLLTGSRDTMVKLWDIVSGQEARSMGGHTGAVSSVLILSPQDSANLASRLDTEYAVTSAPSPSLGISASDDCSIKVWDLHNGVMLKSMYAYSPVTKLVYRKRRDKPCLVSGSGGGKVELWDVESGAPTQTLKTHDDAITGLWMWEDYVYSASADGVIAVHELRDSMTLHTVFISENIKLLTGAPLLLRHVRSLAAIGERIYYGDDAMNLKAVDWKEGVAHKLSNHTTEFGATDAVCVSRDLDLLIASGYDLDNGLGFLNIRQLSTEGYLCSLCDESSSRFIDVTCQPTYPQNEGVTIVTAGAELLVWRQAVTGNNTIAVKGKGDNHNNTANNDNSKLVRVQYVRQFNRPPRHSDDESESEADMSFPDEAEDDDDDADKDQDVAATSPPFTSHRQDSTESRGWFSWCNVL